MEFIDEYHKLYEKTRIWEDTKWMGVPCWKLPMDAFVMQELIYRLKPDYIIETGTGKGGSAMFYASICELMGQGKVITVDIHDRVDKDLIAQHEWSDRITFLHGSSTSPLVIKQIKKLVGNTTKNMVILDSYHTREHELVVMGIYEALVGPGMYMIVEDSHAGKKGHPIEWEWDNDGPYEAIKFFLEVNEDFEVDLTYEKHLMTFNPHGYLRRIK